ncbi:MAG: YkgJ family cysteine cluster protein [Methanomicrobiaceae archaeon]|nr:YkgJ family cysteine cluster protein [Methanomicrobiaceae archaeon]
MSGRHIARTIERLRQDLADLRAYPEEQFEAIIRDVGFSCTCCGRCCTREMNDHVFLLSDDADRIFRMDPGALVPAPYFELCDQHGRFYVSGYSLKMHHDGSCVFLDGDRCRIYASRPAICRVYPYMLQRQPDVRGVSDWRQISGLDLHGDYHTPLSEEQCREIARETRAYEERVLLQELAFYELAGELFAREGLRHIRRTYDLAMRDFLAGKRIDVRVYHQGAFVPCEISRDDYLI